MNADIIGTGKNNDRKSNRDTQGEEYSRFDYFFGIFVMGIGYPAAGAGGEQFLSASVAGTGQVLSKVS